MSRPHFAHQDPPRETLKALKLAARIEGEKTHCQQSLTLYLKMRIIHHKRQEAKTCGPPTRTTDD